MLGAGLIIAGHAVLTPLLQALSMLTNDFVTMARAADRARPSPYPNAWRVRNLTLAAIPLDSFRLLNLVAVPGVGWYGLRLSPGEMQTLTYARTTTTRTNIAGPKPDCSFAGRTRTTGSGGRSSA